MRFGTARERSKSLACLAMQLARCCVLLAGGWLGMLRDVDYWFCGEGRKKEAAFSAGKRRRPANAVGNGRSSGDTRGGKNFPPEAQPADT